MDHSWIYIYTVNSISWPIGFLLSSPLQEKAPAAKASAAKAKAAATKSQSSMDKFDKDAEMVAIEALISQKEPTRKGH